MEQKIKPGKSPLYIVTLISISICVLGFLVFTVLGVADFRSKEEKEQDYREKLINHSLFDDALYFGKKIISSPDSFSNRDTVEKISCLALPEFSTSKIGNKLVLIEYNNSTPSYCYSITMSNTYVISPYMDYNLFKRQHKIYTELVLEGSDLDILFEEAEKALWH